jgi:hypothetical protein
VFTCLEKVWVTVDKVGIPTFGLDRTGSARPPTWARPPWAVPTQSYPGSQGVNPFAYWPQPVPFNQDTVRTPVTCSQSNSSVSQNSELVSSFKEVLSDFKKSMSDDLATVSSRISSLEAGHRVQRG